MIRGLSLSLLVTFCVVAVAPAQAPPRFRWRTGQTLEYRVEQTTTVADTAENKTDTVFTKLNVRKRWQVLAVDGDGIATLRLTLLTLRLETRKPDGSTVLFDSQKADGVDAALNKEMLQYIGQPIAELRVDGRGQVVEVKESRFGPASRFSAELPFRLVLPESAPRVGQTWDRAYVIRLEPPQGAGETYNAVQKYSCQEVAATSLILGVITSVKDLPEAPVERIPLIPFQPQGRIVFDPTAGRMKKAELKMTAEFTDHRGEGSKYVYSSTYVEEVVE
jgi:hypothetical protein